MIEILPIRLLTDDDAQIFGVLNVALGKLARVGLPVGPGIVITPPHLKLKATMEHYDFGKREVFSQSLTLVKKEIQSIPVPEILIKETKDKQEFLFNGQRIRGVKNLWIYLLDSWLEQIKIRLWNSGFYPGITENLNREVVTFVSKLESFGSAFEDTLQDDCLVNVKSGKLHPMDLKKIAEIVKAANKKLFLAYEYEWMVDRGVKLIGIRPYNPPSAVAEVRVSDPLNPVSETKSRSAVKVFFDLSEGFTIEKNIDGIYIASEKIFDLNKPHDSFENLVFRVVESAITFPDSPVFLKLADMHSMRLPDGSLKSEGMGKVRGSLRLLHQKNLMDPLLQVLDFARHKKSLNNIHIVIPFVRGVTELLQIKRELSTKKLMRKASLQYWMEVAVPENIINMEDYLIAGIDGMVLNLDELIAHLNGFDPAEGELALYKNEVEGLIKFLDDGIRLLHKAKVPFITSGSLAFDSRVLEFLVEKGVWGVVAEKYEAHSAKDLLHQVERRIILRKTA